MKKKTKEELAETTRAPSGLKTTLVTGCFMCPFSVAISWPLAASQSVTVSPVTAAMRAPSGLNAMRAPCELNANVDAAFVGFSVSTPWALSASQSFTVPDSPAAAIRVIGELDGDAEGMAAADGVFAGAGGTPWMTDMF